MRGSRAVSDNADINLQKQPTLRIAPRKTEVVSRLHSHETKENFYRPTNSRLLKTVKRV